ncbi:MAG TPA: ATP-binding protein [Gemmatimonadaceae bacterium]|nr:ATP-binding protein [Gemmatimonadaceae bacterium]
MPLTLYEKVSLNFGSGVVAVALIGTLSYVSLGKLAVATHAAGDTEAVLEQVDALRASVADAGTAQRDYLLGAAPDDLERFERARMAAARDIARLETALSADVEASRRVDSLTPLLATHLADLERIAQLRHRAGIDSAAVAMRDASVVATRERLASLLAELRDDHRVLFAARWRAQAARASDAGILLAVGLLVSFIAAALALSNIRRYLAHRRKLELQRTAVLEQEQAARNAAEEANRAKTDFLRMMSHELRTPLTAIQGYLELLEMGIYGGMTQEQVSILRRIESNERHLLAIINDLLDFARVDARRVELRIAPLPVRDIRLAVDPVCRPQIDSKQLRYEWHAAEDHMIVRADREKVRQIVVNLVSNACKFTPRGGTIEVDCVRSERAVEMRVTDSGPGIPPLKLDAIFEPFVQLDNGLTRSTAGTGLGLAISRELARAMGGDLAVSSTLGNGSTFVLTLPRGDVDSDLLPETTSSASLWGAG